MRNNSINLPSLIHQHQRYIFHNSKNLKLVFCIFQDFLLVVLRFIFFLNQVLRYNLFDGLAFGDLRVSDHLVGGADLDEGELGVFSDLRSQRCFSTVRWA